MQRQHLLVTIRALFLFVARNKRSIKNDNNTKKDLKMERRREGSPIYHYDVYKCSHNGSFTACCASQWQARHISIQACSILKKIIIFFHVAGREGGPPARYILTPSTTKSTSSSDRRTSQFVSHTFI